MEEHGLDFGWRSGHKPTLSKGGQTVELDVVDFVPFLNVNCAGKVFALPGVAASGAAAPEVPEVVAAVEAAAAEPAELEPDSDDEPAVNFSNCDKLKAEALTLTHLYSHLPKNPYCEICRVAKARRKGARALGPGVRERAAAHGDIVMMDFTDAGPYRKSNTLVLQDDCTNYLAATCHDDRTTESVVEALLLLPGH